MPSKTIWIKSKSAWTASLRSVSPLNDASWLAVSKSSGAANNDINGEWVTVTLTDNISKYPRRGYVDITSGGKIITVSISQQAGAGEKDILVNQGMNLINNNNQLINIR